MVQIALYKAYTIAFQVRIPEGKTLSDLGRAAADEQVRAQLAALEVEPFPFDSEDGFPTFAAKPDPERSDLVELRAVVERGQDTDGMFLDLAIALRRLGWEVEGA